MHVFKYDFHFQQKKGAKRKKKVTGVNAVHVACVTGDVEVLKLLLAAAQKQGQFNKKNLNAKTKVRSVLETTVQPLIDALADRGKIEE